MLWTQVKYYLKTEMKLPHLLLSIENIIMIKIIKLLDLKKISNHQVFLEKISKIIKINLDNVHQIKTKIKMKIIQSQENQFLL